jgi:hypothetical protein
MSVRPVRLLVPLAVCAALLVGCGDDGDSKAGGSDPSSQSTSDLPASDDSSSEAPTADGSQTPGTDDAPDDSDAPASTESAKPTAPVPADAQELCGVFGTAYQAVVKQTSDIPSDESSPLPAELVDSLHAWGDGLADAELPSSLTDDEREGIKIMSRLLGDIPDRATAKDLEEFDEKLSDGDDDKVEAASDWVGKTCNLDVS